MVNLTTNALSPKVSQIPAGSTADDLGFAAQVLKGISGWITPPILVPLAAAAAIAAYGFYLRL